MNTVQRGMPPAVSHPLWDAWVSHSYVEDLRLYRVKEYLYHYAQSWESVLAILSSRSIWASDARQLKDTTELEHGLPICYNALHMIREPILLKHVALVKQGFRERFLYDTFIACFSSSNNIRSQWDTYPDKQRGFVITFDNLMLSALHAVPGLRIMPVEYGIDNQVARARATVGRALEDLASQPHFLSDELFIWTIQSRFTLLAVELFFLCTSFKAADFRDENEWRLIYARYRHEPRGLSIQQRQVGEKQVRYVAIDLMSRYAQHSLPAFAAVRAGPHTSSGAASIVQRYLREFEPRTNWETHPPFPNE
jgi:hypothetical protein